MKARKWISAAVVGVLVTAASAETFALHRAHAVVGIRVGAPVFSYGPVVRPVGFHRAPRMVAVERVNYGSVDFNVQPQRSKIWIDGAYFGIADDFNGWPQTAKLSAGYHNVRVVAPDGRTDTRRIYVAAGRELDFNLKF